LRRRGCSNGARKKAGVVTSIWGSQCKKGGEGTPHCGRGIAKGPIRGRLLKKKIDPKTREKRDRELLNNPRVPIIRFPKAHRENSSFSITEGEALNESASRQKVKPSICDL